VGDRCKVTSDNKLYIKRMLESLQHPFILKTDNCDYLKDRQIFVCFRPYHKESLRDLIHKSKPTEKYSKKYTTITGKGLSEKKIAKFGRQVLEALIYFQSQKFPFYHLSTCNVIIDDSGVARLTDYENDLIGVDLNPKILKLIRLTLGKVEPTVVCFGALLYEMAVGYELDSATLDDLPSVAPKVKKILQTIFQPAEQLVSLEDLKKTPLFSEVQLFSPWTPQNIKRDKVEQVLEAANADTLETFKTTNANKKISKQTSFDNSQKSTSSPKLTSSSKQQPSNISSTSTPGPVNVPPPPEPPKIQTQKSGERSQLLGSIETFSPKKLKKAVTNDRSVPIL